MDQIKRLQEIKDSQELSFERMSRDIGISSRTLFRWIHGQNVPSLMARDRLNEYLQKQSTDNIG